MENTPPSVFRNPSSVLRGSSNKTRILTGEAARPQLRIQLVELNFKLERREEAKKQLRRLIVPSDD